MSKKVDWRNNQSQSAKIIFEHLKNKLKINDDGSYLISGDDIDLPIDILLEKTNHSFKLDDETLFDAMKNSIIKSIKDDKEPFKKILNHFHNTCFEICKKNKNYRLTTTISLPCDWPVNQLKIGEQTVSFYSKPPKKIKNIREKILEESKYLDLSKKQNHKDYLYISVKIKAPNQKTAFKYGMETIDLIRGLLSINFVSTINAFAYPVDQKYKNEIKVSLGPIHTIDITNDNSTNDWWYRENYKDTPVIKLTDINKTAQTLKRDLKRLKNNPFIEKITPCIIGYIDALEMTDEESKHLKLWANLEKILDTDDARQIIRRACFFFDDRELHRAILSSYKECRNSYTHTGKAPKNIRMKTFYLSYYLKTILSFFIANNFKSESYDSYISTISISETKEQIEDTLKKYNKVKKFISR